MYAVVRQRKMRLIRGESPEGQLVHACSWKRIEPPGSMQRAMAPTIMRVVKAVMARKAASNLVMSTMLSE
jgi:hypothetical protein